MLVQGLLETVSFLLSGIAAIIPDIDFPYADELADFAVFLGGRLSSLDGFLPITELTVVIGWIFVSYVPFVVSFLIFRFVYAHLPVVGS